MNEKNFRPEIIKPKEKNIIEKLKENPITLINEKGKNTLDGLREQFGNQKIVVCDFDIDDIERKGQGQERSWGFEWKNVLNIDHHIPIKRMQRYISSTNLAIEYVKDQGIVKKDWIVVINHADCDSLLSSAIIRGILEPKEEFGEAAIAADHTGKENKIADLLQALMKKRDLEFSLRNLELLLNNQSLEEEAQKLLKKRLQERLKVKEIVKSGKFQQTGKVAFTVLEEKIDAGLLPAFLPDAQIIMIASPLETDPKKWEMKLRLGVNVPAGFILDKKLIVSKLDPNYGGRWNAGANKRGGGTNMNPEEYAKKLDEVFK